MSNPHASPGSTIQCRGVRANHPTSSPPQILISKVRMMTKVKLEKTVWQFLKELNTQLPYDSNSTPGIYSRESKIQFMSTQKFVHEYS